MSTQSTSLAPTRAAVQGKSRARSDSLASAIAIYTGLILGAVIVALPFVWMIFTAIKTDKQVRTIPLEIWPSPMVFAPFVRAWFEAEFGDYTFNSLVVAGGAAFSNVMISALMGYTLARLRFKGKNLIFMLILSTTMVPAQIAFIPMFLLVAKMPLLGGNNILGAGGSGLLNTYVGLMVPHLVTAFGVFLMRQYLIGFPNDLEDAARVDGASEFTIFWRIMLPLTTPVLITLFLLQFTGVWNDLLWPLVVTTSDDMKTLPLGLSGLRGVQYTEWNLVMAGTAISVLPTVLLFVIGQRYFERSIVVSGLK
jgi:multiple sugar transport system permease protein